MTAFYTHRITAYSTRFLLVIFAILNYTYIDAQCNPDVTPPVAVCNVFINVSLDGDGLATIFAETFDENSFDNCCPVTLEVRRDGSTCAGFESDADFGDSVTFCCDDANAGNSIFVVLQVSDCNGNSNTCFTEVMVEDKLSPIVTCPADVVTTCGTYFNNIYDATLLPGDSLNTVLTETFGDATLFDNCQTFAGISNVFSSNNSCEDFTIERTWTVSDGNAGNATASCTQVIQVIYENVWDVAFPADAIVNDFGMATPDFTGTPVISGNSCALVGLAYEDQVLDAVVGCAKIIRTWTVINWCNSEVMENVQIIDVEGSNPPSIQCPANFVVYLNGSTGYANVTIPSPTAIGDTDNYTVTATSNLPDFNAVTFNADSVLVGIYTATFLVSDFCDNVASCSTTIEVAELGNVNCPADMTIDCDVYQNDLETMLSQLAGDSEAQNESLDQFFGAPSFQNGTNISSSVSIDVNDCGQGMLTRVWELDDDVPTGNCFTPIASSVSADNGDQVCVDVTINGFDDILGFQYTMNFDPTALAFNSVVNPENVEDIVFGISIVNNGNLTVGWVDGDLEGVTVPDGTLLYSVCFDIIGGGGQITDFTFSGSPTVIEILEENEEEVCFDNIPGSIAIGLGGPNGACFVPMASSADTDEGDLVCVDVTANGLQNIVSFQYSMNFDPTVLEFASIENESFLNVAVNFGLTEVADGIIRTSWANVAAPTTLPNGYLLYRVCFNAIGNPGESSTIEFSGNPLSTEVSNSNNQAVCFLGVDGQININTINIPPTGDCLIISNSNETPNEGDQFCIDATVENFTSFLSFQYSINFDPTILEFETISDPEVIDDLAFGITDIENGKISVVWFDNNVSGVSVSNGTSLYQICFTVIGTEGQNTAVTFSSNPTLIEVIDSNEEPVCFFSNAGQITIGMNGSEPLVVNPPPTVLCTQVITIEYTSNWSVVFPSDATVNCTFGDLEAGEPEILNASCALIGIAYEDVIFNNTPGDGYEIQRTWTVINWCDDSTETHTQIINVNDDAAPNFVNNCNLPEVCLTGNNFSCMGGLTIPIPEVSDCSSNIDLTASSDFGNGFGPFVNVDAGQYLVTFTATDPFGNVTTCISNINVVDCTPPVAICDETVTVSLADDSNSGGTATIFTETLDDGSYDNCSATISLSFAANIQLNTLNFTCDNVGSGNFSLFVTDENGNQNSCDTEVIVQDVLNICPSNPCEGVNTNTLACNSNLQVSLDLDGNAQLNFDAILEGIPANCIDVLDLSFAENSDVDVLNFNCSNLGNNLVTVYSTLDNGQQIACWGIVNISDPLESCGDPLDCDNDVIPPTVYCKDGIVVELLHINNPNNMGFIPQIALYASDVDNGSFDNCTNPVSFSFSPDLTDTEIVYTCDYTGENPIQLWVTDENGNQNSCSTFVIVQANQGQCAADDDCLGNTIPPVAICDSEIVASLELSGELQIFTSDIDDGSYDDCSDFVQLSFSANAANSITTFTCDDLGENFVTLYVTDENGNQNQCFTSITIQDNLNACDNECLNDEIDPEAFCISALVIQMPSNGMLTLSASLFDVGSSDNCTDNLNLQISTVDSNGEIINGPASGLPFNINNVGANNIVLTVEDAAGNTDECSTILLLQSNPPQVIRGKIFVDENDDCTYNTGEMGLDTWQVKLEAIDDTLATEPGIVVLPPDFTIDADGNYTITLPEDFVFFTPDSSVVNVNNLNPYLRVSLATGFNYGQNCDYNYFINSTTNILDTVEIDFPVQVIEDCPQLSVDVSVPYLRRCFDNNYSINYCNFGSVDAENAYIEVDFDEFLTINSSSLPWTSINGTIYRFDLGTVGAAECGSFTVNATVSCDAVLGQTHCVGAYIYPAVLCNPQSPQWSGASVDITGTCDGDEVRFLIKNIGDDDMTEDAQYIVIEDVIMYNTGTFNLAAGESTEIVMPANGSTWRIEADQAPNHPGSSMPAVAVEGCSTDGNFSLGMVTQFVQNDNDPFVSINCLENVGSFDPNDKMSIVTGYGDDHYLNQNTDIEYMIRFQNTGTDTAFNIVVIDTLDINLDPLSVRPGASSHPYDFTILGNNVLKFNFDNITLPDSNVNVALSQGFLKFRVAQYPDVALETVIENNAAIYFDFNEPIITNVVFHTIGHNFVEMPNATGATPTPIASIKVFPNPFTDEATVEISGLDVPNGSFKVYDAQGRLLQTFDFTGNKFSVNREELPSGLYFYQLESKTEELVKSGKLVIK